MVAPEAEPAPLPVPPAVLPDEVFEVVLLDHHTGSVTVAVAPGIPISPAPSAPPRPVTGAMSAASSSRGSETATHAPEHSHEQPTHSDLMVMRPPSLDRGVSSEFIDELLAHSRPLEPRPDIPDERLRAEAADARAALAALRKHGGSSEELFAAQMAVVAANEARKAEELKPSGGGTYETRKDQFTAHVAADGTVQFDDAKNLQVHGLGGSFDLTDWAMRDHNQDPYSSAKRRYLDRTRDQRVAIGRRHRTAQLEHSAGFALGNVNRLWAMTTDLAARKQGLFELWDECAETGDDELIAGGAAARDLIMSVIQHRLGADAYTDAELADLNAHRHSTAKFDPHAARP